MAIALEVQIIRASNVLGLDTLITAVAGALEPVPAEHPPFLAVELMAGPRQRASQTKHATREWRKMLRSDAPGFFTRPVFNAVFGLDIAVEHDLAGVIWTTTGCAKRAIYLQGRVAAHAAEFSPTAVELATILAPEWTGTLPELFDTVHALAA